MENTKIKEWYLKEYSSDDYGNYLKDETTFLDVFHALDTYQNVYKIMFEDDEEDSLVRERVFEKLAEIMEVDYDYIYEQWLLGEED